VFLGGTWEHPFGTDQLGRDFGMLMTYGTRQSVLIALVGVVIASAIGLLLGLGAGLWGGRVDTIIMFGVDARLSLPGIVITIAAVASFGSSALSLMLIIGFTGWAGFARIVRGEMLTLREMTFIRVSQSIGAGPWRIIREHALVNMGSVVIVNSAQQVVGFIMLESSLSFLGLGIQPPGVSLGLLVAEGREYLLDAWWLAIFPSAIIALIVFLVTMTGDWLRDHLDPRTAGAAQPSRTRKKGTPS
jgi:peptide/nickel transport system permease protein